LWKANAVAAVLSTSVVNRDRKTSGTIEIQRITGTSKDVFK
jgi:hypothetical protein